MALASSSKFRTQFPKSSNSAVVRSISIFLLPKSMIKSSQTCVHGAKTHKHFGDGWGHSGSLWSLWHWKEACITSLSWQFYIYSRGFCLTLSLRSKTCSRCVRWGIWIFFNCTGCSMIEVLLILKGVIELVSGVCSLSWKSVQECAAFGFPYLLKIKC